MGQIGAWLSNNVAFFLPVGTQGVGKHQCKPVQINHALCHHPPRCSPRPCHFACGREPSKPRAGQEGVNSLHAWLGVSRGVSCLHPGKDLLQTPGARITGIWDFLT